MVRTLSLLGLNSGAGNLSLKAEAALFQECFGRNVMGVTLIRNPARLEAMNAQAGYARDYEAGVTFGDEIGRAADALVTKA